MKIIRIFALSVSILACSALSAQNQRGIDHPMTRAILNAYTELIQSDPSDYESYLNRGAEYYNHNEYILALNDVNKALSLTPQSDDAFQFQGHWLRGNIYLQTNKLQDALADFTIALTLDPESFSTLYLKANTDFQLGNYAAAKEGYQKLHRLNPRNSDALIGLGRVAVKENNLGIANDYLESAVQMSPNDPEVYLRRAKVREMMGNDNGAVDDLIISLSLNSSKNPGAVNAIVAYADVNYPAVMSSLSNAIAQAPENALYWYLRAQIAAAHNHYANALSDYRKIIDDRLYSYQGLYASIAECQYNMGQYAEALDNVDRALQTIKNNAQYYILKSKSLRALGRDDEAIEAAAAGHAVNMSSTDALVQMAKCYIDKGDYSQANALLGEATLTNADDPYVYLLRAHLLEKYLNQPVAANQFRQQAAEIEIFNDDNVKSLKGFALLESGDVAGARAWIDNILANGDSDGLANYYAACLYSRIDDNDRALACAEESLKRGYANYFNWMLNADEPINVANLRDDLRFLNLIQRYSTLFE
ncbi:MAG: tetratricopeptide repeat protein [Bacteroides sp.]|nr:tetratricopeptide repeat protein [Bacteroides sp.]MCM1457050.1 tetratricopeptide repeat protein [Lachnoclostridium sp.]